jgi:hypothetical protein
MTLFKPNLTSKMLEFFINRTFGNICIASGLILGCLSWFITNESGKPSNNSNDIPRTLITVDFNEIKINDNQDHQDYLIEKSKEQIF